ncbi:hypothetical protein Ccrd_014800 [Cynara cardunculus var. scolymus]|uniref:Uncharacterized protein n=1 Tax=Cynara cardunculus var. scolymus TaxID=59895 RepID=A0A103YD20_CYNCS|nr:hypothetical protein Ccrd_014800 [Cynara cardunculus var. scolymus]
MLKQPWILWNAKGICRLLGYICWYGCFHDGC